ncbi:hypothetical protein ACFL1H_05840 [Nanoarchaeota archaeon]
MEGNINHKKSIIDITGYETSFVKYHSISGSREIIKKKLKKSVTKDTIALIHSAYNAKIDHPTLLSHFVGVEFDPIMKYAIKNDIKLPETLYDCWRRIVKRNKSKKYKLIIRGQRLRLQIYIMYFLKLSKVLKIQTDLIQFGKKVIFIIKIKQNEKKMMN